MKGKHFLVIMLVISFAITVEVIPASVHAYMITWKDWAGTADFTPNPNTDGAISTANFAPHVGNARSLAGVAGLWTLFTTETATATTNFSSQFKVDQTSPEESSSVEAFLTGRLKGWLFGGAVPDLGTGILGNYSSTYSASVDATFASWSVTGSTVGGAFFGTPESIPIDLPVSGRGNITVGIWYPLNASLEVFSQKQRGAITTADFRDSFYVNVKVPEPSTLLLVGSGLAGIIGFGRKRLFRKA